MKKIFLFIFLFISMSFLVSNVYAEETKNVVVMEDLGFENPGILPTSPFYFLKEWQRKAKELLTFDKVNKAIVQLESANERAAEIKKMEEIMPENIEAIEKAFQNYQSNAVKLEEKFKSFSNTKNNKNGEKLLDLLTQQSIRHEQLFEELKDKFSSDDKIKDIINQSQETIKSTIAQIPENQESSEDFANRLEKALATNPIQKLGDITGVRAIEILNSLQEKLPEAVQSKIETLKEKIAQQLEKEIKNIKESGINVENLKETPGNTVKRIEALEDIKCKITSSSLQSALESVKEEIISGSVGTKEIPKTDIELCYKETADFITKIKSEIKDNKDLDTASSLAEKAQELFSINKLKESLESSTEARSIANKVYTEWLKFKEDISSDAFCGKSTLGACEKNEDCIAGGCSGQICGLKSENSSLVSTCEWQNCYKKPENVSCGCVEGKCSWLSLSTSTTSTPINCPLYSMAVDFKEKCDAQGGEIKTEKNINGCMSAPKCVLPSLDVCINKTTGEKLSLSEAKQIIIGSDCLKQGNVVGGYDCNESSGTWWVDLDIKKSGCSPACVISASTKKAEINWRCTGLIPPSPSVQSSQ